jgi:hypothetical protein
MAKKRKKRRSAARGPRRGSRKQPQSALILECNAERLERDSISMARDVHSMVQGFLPAAPCDLVQVTTEHQLLADFADRATHRYDIVLVVGHSSVDELVLARDRRLPWTGVAKWLERFSPRVVVLAGCEGGRWLPSKALFDGLKSLKEIYGTPVLSTQPELRALGLLVLFLLAGGKVSAEWLPWAQVAAFALTDGVIFRQTRAEFRSSGPAEAATWRMLETVLRRLLNR